MHIQRGPLLHDGSNDAAGERAKAAAIRSSIAQGAKQHFDGGIGRSASRPRERPNHHHASMTRAAEHRIPAVPWIWSEPKVSVVPAAAETVVAPLLVK